MPVTTDIWGQSGDLYKNTSLRRDHRGDIIWLSELFLGLRRPDREQIIRIFRRLISLSSGKNSA
jgi:hypothetical protein